MPEVDDDAGDDAEGEQADGEEGDCIGEICHVSRSCSSARGNMLVHSSNHNHPSCDRLCQHSFVRRGSAEVGIMAASPSIVEHLIMAAFPEETGVGYKSYRVSEEAPINALAGAIMKEESGRLCNHGGIHGVLTDKFMESSEGRTIWDSQDSGASKGITVRDVMARQEKGRVIIRSHGGVSTHVVTIGGTEGESEGEARLKKENQKEREILTERTA